MIAFHLDSRSGLPAYLQLVQQVKQALRLGVLQVGDRLPTVREVASSIAINPNTVLKAYGELEHDGLIVSRPGQGTFIVGTLDGPSLKSQAVLRRGLAAWLRDDRANGLDEASMVALFKATLRELLQEGVA